MSEEMNEKQETVETAEQETETAAGDQEKKFTQEDVNRIIQERLKRNVDEKEKVQEMAAQIEEMKQREKKIDCKEYLLDNGYPVELLEIIDTSDTEAFKEKADKAFNVFGARRNKPVAPLASESIYMANMADLELQSAFDDTKHKPKQFPALNYDE